MHVNKHACGWFGYNSTNDNNNISPAIHGAEYQYHSGPNGNLHDPNVPCAVCYSSTRAASIMVPAKTVCPSSWTRDYYGYLTVEYQTHHRSSFNCMDVNPDVVDGGEVLVTKMVLSFTMCYLLAMALIVLHTKVTEYSHVLCVLSKQKLYWTIILRYLLYNTTEL